MKFAYYSLSGIPGLIKYPVKECKDGSLKVFHNKNKKEFIIYSSGEWKKLKTYKCGFGSIEGERFKFGVIE